MNALRWRFLATAVASLALAGATWAAQDAPQSGAKPEAKAGRAALRRAADVVKAVKGLRGEARTAALERAVQAYRAVLAEHATSASVGAVAWFEIGELERRKPSLAAAEAAYAKSAELDPSAYGARAGLQRTHMQRRQKQWDKALAGYRAIAALDTTPNRVHTARVWIGRCLEAKGDLDGAAAAYESALQATEKPTHVIELCNWLAKARVAQGDLDAATAAIARADQAVPAGDGPAAQRAAKAAAAMSARRALQRARDRANRAHLDAQQLELERGVKR